MMGPKFFQVLAVMCASTGCILFIVALASPSWLVGCLRYANIFKALMNHPNSNEQLKSNIALSAKMFQNVSLCIHQGIFKFSMKAGSFMDVHSGIHVTSISKYALFGSFGIVCAVFIAVIGVAFLILGISRDTSNYNDKSKASDFVKRAMIFLAVSGLAGVIGMAIFSGGSVKVTHNPFLFMSNFELVAQGSNLNPMASAFSGELPAVRGRRKRDIDTSNLGLDAPSENYLATTLEGLDPEYGRAFIIGWVATVVLLFAAVLAATARRYLFDRSYSGLSNAPL